MLRKHIVGHAVREIERGELPIETIATVFVTSEHPEHPIEHAFDTSHGPRGTRWVASETGEQALELVFDQPQRIERVILEVEERAIERTQALELAVSTDQGHSYRSVRHQDYTFSPNGATFEREEWRIREEGVTRLRLRIVPDKQGRPCYATITTLKLYG
jgi:hypothetical protein